MAPRARYGTAAALLLALAALGGCTGWPAGTETIGVERVVLFEFDDPSEVELWQAFGDAAGEPPARLVHRAPGTALFDGTASAAEGRGPAVIAAPLPAGALAGDEGLILRVRGDGRRYILYVTIGPENERYVYQAPFDTREDRWREVLAPFVEFEPHRLAERLPWRRVPAADITGVGIMVAEPSGGPFELQIDYIHAYTVPRF
ncbi:MAG: hypothetical protein GX591_10955 [Planctomycetes bacterium]|nr:hypothetical protein [Planctomycetota bacterium]